MLSQPKNTPFTCINGFYDDTRHGFYGRQGGVSAKGCASLNASFAPNDAKENVLQNRAIIARSIGVAADKLAILKQTHSSTCVKVSEHSQLPFPDKLEGDALVTDMPNIALGVLTADCAPVLFHGTKEDGSSVIGAAHAGWGGALGSVLTDGGRRISALETPIQRMMDLGAKIETIKAAIGPCIAQTSYEVDQDFLAPFLNDDPMSIAYFKIVPINETKNLFDLKGYCKYRLQKAGLSLENIFVSPINTYTSEQDFFSHRRATHQGTPKEEGRQLSVIRI